jgi:uncharacterized protein
MSFEEEFVVSLRSALSRSLALSLLACMTATPTAFASDKAPLVIGDTFTIDSKIVGETRRINVYIPPVYAESADLRLPVLYMPDGGLAEDFIHIAGLVQISATNATMRPFLLVGIENTQRRRDLTGPTEVESDKKIAPVVGKSADFRRFIREELMPQVRERYRTTDETAIVGESAAGLFAVESFLLEPDLFDTCIAIDPSLWWNAEGLNKAAAQHLKAGASHTRTLYLATSDEPGILAATQHLVEVLRENAPPSLTWHYQDMPEEHHGTIYHPAAIEAFRSVFAPPAAK